MTTRRSLLQSAAFWPFVVPRDFETTDRIPPIQPLAATAKTVTSSGLSGMLGLVPGSFDLGDPPHFLTQYASFAAQSAAIGVPAPQSSDENGLSRWSRGVAHVFFGFGIDPSDHPLFFMDLFAELGFKVFDLDEFLVLGFQDRWTLFVRVRLESAVLIAVWEAAGFKPVHVDDSTAWSLPFHDGPYDLNSPSGKLHRARMNNVVVLPDGTLIFTSSRRVVAEVVDVVGGTRSSLAERVDIKPLLRILSPDLSGAVLLDGSQLSWETNIQRFVSGGGAPEGVSRLMETFRDSGALPPISFAIVGVTPGGPVGVSETEVLRPPDIPKSRLEIALMMRSREDAENAIPMIQDRLAVLC